MVIKSKNEPAKPGSLKRAGERIGVSLPTCYKLMREGKLRTYRVGRARRVTDAAIEECIAALEAESSVSEAA